MIGNGTGSSARSNALTMLKNGNTGFGTETPTNVLEVSGEASYTDASDMGTDDADFASKAYVDGAIATADDGDWTISGSDIYSAFSGNVGLGTSSPSSKLTFDNTTGDGFDEWSDYKILLYTRSTPQGSYGLGIKSNTLAFNTAYDFDFDQEGVTVMTIQDGKLGIGTTAPARQLHISEVMRLEPIPSPPSSPREGDMYMNSTTHKLMVYDGTTWQACW